MHIKEENSDTCFACCNFGGEEGIQKMQIGGKTLYFGTCKVKPNALLFRKNIEKARQECEYFGHDFSSEDICGKCETYLGGADWGLACQKHYGWLPQYVSKACKDFEKKKDLQ